MQVIPAIDLIGGKCVRLTEGSFDAQKVYSDDPAGVARRFADAGAARIHVIDLEGAKSGEIKNLREIEKIVSLPKIEVQVGGGIRTLETVDRMMQMGVSQVIIGSTAIRTPATLAEWLTRFGPDRFIIALDLKDSWLVTDAWQKSDSTGLASIIDELSGMGVRKCLSTDVRRDGRLLGPNVKLYEQLVSEFPFIDWIASGGVSSVSDIEELARTGVSATVVGKALYEGLVPLSILGGG